MWTTCEEHCGGKSATTTLKFSVLQGQIEMSCLGDTPVIRATEPSFKKEYRSLLMVPCFLIDLNVRDFSFLAQSKLKVASDSLKILDFLSQLSGGLVNFTLTNT